ncbi:unnamed protein product [Calypogeia fissa]
MHRCDVARLTSLDFSLKACVAGLLRVLFRQLIMCSPEDLADCVIPTVAMLKHTHEVIDRWLLWNPHDGWINYLNVAMVQPRPNDLDEYGTARVYRNQIGGSHSIPAFSGKIGGVAIELEVKN